MKLATALLTTILVLSSSALDENHLRGGAAVVRKEVATIRRSRHKGHRRRRSLSQAIATDVVKDVDGYAAAEERQLNPGAALVILTLVAIAFDAASILVTGASIGQNIMNNVSGDKPLTSLIVDVPTSTAEEFELTIDGGSVEVADPTATVTINGRAKGNVDGDSVECWDFKLVLTVVEPWNDADCKWSKVIGIQLIRAKSNADNSCWIFF